MMAARHKAPRPRGVLIVDDLLATGGTTAASIELVEKLGAIVVKCAFVIELGFLKGRAKLPEGKDPCDYLLSAGKTAFDSVLKVGLEALEFKWRQVSHEYNSSNTGLGRRRAIEAYLEQIAS